MDRVSVNFFPTAFELDFGGVAASAIMTNSGFVGEFGMVFSGVGDELFLSTLGAGQLFPNCGIADLVKRLERVLVAMAADPTQRLSSIDSLDEVEHLRVDAWSNRSVVAESVGSGFSIPALFAAQVGRVPEAGALTCEGRSLTYRELDEAVESVGAVVGGRGCGSW